MAVGRPIAVFIGQVTENRIIFAIAIAFAFCLVGLGPLGWRILSESDEEWAPVSARPAATPAQENTA